MGAGAMVAEVTVVGATAAEAMAEVEAMAAATVAMVMVTAVKGN